MRYGFEVLVALIILLVVGSTVGYVVFFNSTRKEKTVTIKRMWVKQSGGDSQKYLFSDTEGIVYCIKDEWLLWCFDASNRWAQLEEGKTYRIVFYGWRIPILSWYENAIEIEEV